MLNIQHLYSKQKLGNVVINNILKNNVIQPSSSILSSLNKQNKFKLQNSKLSILSLQHQNPVQNCIIQRNLIQNGLIQDSALNDLIQKNSYSVKATNDKWEMDYDAAVNYWVEKDKVAVRMEKAALIKKIESYITAHDTCALATESPEMVRNTTIEYRYFDGAFYLFSEGGLKFKNLKVNKKVGMAIYEPYSGFGNLKSLQVEGIASMIEPFSDEYLKAMKYRKIPLEMMKKLENPMNLIKINVTSFDYVDADLKKEGVSIKQHIDMDNKIKSISKWDMDYDAAVNHWVEKDKTSVRMENSALKKKIESYITAHDTCALATASPEMVRNTTIEYRYFDDAFYLFSEGGLKFKNLKVNKKVGMAIYEPYSGFGNLKSLQVEGIVNMIEPFSDEYLKAMKYRKIPLENMKKLENPMNLIKINVTSFDYVDADLKKAGFSTRQHMDIPAHKWEMDYDTAANYWLDKDKTAVHMEEGVLKEKIESYIKSHNTCSLATGSATLIRNTPIEYNYVNGCFYFFSEGGNKYKGLKENKNVSIAICEPYVGFTNYKSVQIRGIASMIEPFSDEYIKLLEFKKIPVDNMRKLSPPMNLIKINVKSIDYLDSSLKKEGFSNRQHIDIKETKNEAKSNHNWEMDYDAAVSYWVEKDKASKHVEESILKEKIEKYIKSRNTCALATGSAGMIRNTPIEYNYVNGYFYFFSEGGLKFKGLKENKNVCIAICEPYSGFTNFKSVQVDGVANMIEPFSDEYLKILEYKKIPVEALKKLEKPMSLIKVTVKSFDYLDSDFKKEGFGYRQHMKGWTL